MKKLLIISFSLFLISLYSHAQLGEVYVSLGGGVSLPTGDFAAIEFPMDSTRAGFAKPGGNFNVTFGYRISEYFSLTGMLNGSVNRFDYIQLQDRLNSIYSEDLPETTWIVETKSWGTGGLQLGVMASLPLSRNTLYLDGRVLGGFSYVYSPEINALGMEDGNEVHRIFYDQTSAVSWTLDFGAGFRYHRNRSQYFTLYADYVMSDPHFSNVENTWTYPEEGQETISYSQKITAVNISLGLGYIIQ